MARNVAVIDAPPERVWQVLADPASYADWVVGSDTIRGVDGAWPQPRSRFHHRVGTGPFKLRDHTEVLESDPPRRLVLRAKTRPLFVARVELSLIPEGGRTRVVMDEGPDGPWRFVFPPPLHYLIRMRNKESLRRLARIARPTS